jgi:hypothetical protein
MEVKRHKLMRIQILFLLTLYPLTACPQEKGVAVFKTTVPFILDHNRMIIDAEFRREDGTWRKTRLWVDSGNPRFMVSRGFAEDMGIKNTDTLKIREIPSPSDVRIGNMRVNFDNIISVVDPIDKWMFNTMHIDANLPSTVLQRYQVIFDYPAGEFTLAIPGSLTPRGIPSHASVNYSTGIIQMDAEIDGKLYSFALDNGSSFSFTTDSIINQLAALHPDWPQSTGATGSANIWGWWPDEEKWKMVRIPELRWGSLTFINVIISGLPPFFRGGTDVGTNYSRKTARPVNGFLGPNIFKNCRIEILYSDSTVYLNPAPGAPLPDMDIVGITIRILDDKRYEIVGSAIRNGAPLVEGVRQGDILLQINNLRTTGETMGKVVDALRGSPGDIKILKLQRDGKKLSVTAKVDRLL